MPRPRLRDDAEILDAVGRIAGERGLAWTLADVAAAAGLSPAALVQRFGSKHGLLVAFARRSAAASLARLEAAGAAADGPARDRAVAALLALTAGVESPAALANSVALLHLDLTDPALLAITRELFAGLEERLGALVGPETARALLTAWNGSLITWAVRREGPLPTWVARDLRATLRPAE